MGPWKQRLTELFQREKVLKLVVLLGICGIGLIGLSSFWGPSSQPEEEPRAAGQEDYASQLESEIVRVVTAITGEEAPTVVVTLADSGRSLYASDQRENTREEEEGSSTERETSHVLLEDADGAQWPLTVTQTQPEVQGVVVVSALAGDPAVREKLLTAVCTALDVSTARVCVTSRA